ncbi:DM DNA binding domain protein [Ancylostoma caninum]|uniref:DM DNA binding domain protein n=1 Tax=Ancylostoma caninum TaxID=29170 RepID=A0A368FM07_ANCCA|nr:DM DNA binding domain protein [Ancylostoma caninum]
MHDHEESEIDVVALSPAPSQNSYNSNQSEKKYFCQRCLNHDLQFPRKGHKPVCKYANCTCSDCIMVEQRRQLNNMLSKSKLAESPRETVNGRRVRDPQCARCRQHGFRVPLRGHKRVLCQFATCKCEMCELVEDRRSLMAKQIKLRRDQQRQRNSIDDRHSSDSTGEHEMTEPSSAEVSPSPLIELPHPVAVYPCAPAPLTPPQITATLPMVLPPSQMLPAVPNPFLLPLPLFQIFTQLTQHPH